ncbi:hypothetical protein FOA52_000694 [Chlamydomonas sp. UWO 241]|nr:hypothetical protein FOA52_000694 [Chlamydomonas sp. UWO 241]
MLSRSLTACGSRLLGGSSPMLVSTPVSGSYDESVEVFDADIASGGGSSQFLHGTRMGSQEVFDVDGEDEASGGMASVHALFSGGDQRTGGGAAPGPSTSHAMPIVMRHVWPNSDAPIVGSISSSLKASGGLSQRLAQHGALSEGGLQPGGPHLLQQHHAVPAALKRSQPMGMDMGRMHAMGRMHDEDEDGMGIAMMGSSLPRLGALGQASDAMPMPISSSMRIAGGATSMRRTTDAAPPAFMPPHVLAAESYQDAGHSAFTLPSSVANSSRHKSIADRLKAVVFEQSGFQPMATAHGFLA